MNPPLTKRPEAAPSPAAAAASSAPPALTADVAWALVQPEIDALSPRPLVAPRVDLQVASITVLRVVGYVQSAPTLAARFARIAELGELDADVFAQLERYAHASWYARHHQRLADLTHRTAAVPAAVITQGAELLDRMLRLARYHFANHPDEGRLVAKLNASPGHLKLANTLFSLADLYARHPAVVAGDAPNFRATDERDARIIVAAIREARSSRATSGLALWTRRCACLWTLLSRTYATVQPLALWLLRDSPKAAAKHFPSLVTGSRRAAPRRKPAPVR